MTRDEVIRAAREAGAYPLFSEDNHQLSGNAAIERFAALIEAAATEKANERANTSWALMCEKMVKAEREACLRCYSPGDTADDWADKIRSRGSDKINEKDTAE